MSARFTFAHYFKIPVSASPRWCKFSQDCLAAQINSITEGGDRAAQRRAILGALFDGELTLAQAVAEAELRLSREASPHRTSNQVFASGWAKRLIHTHTSVFYTWAVLEDLIAAGQSRCFVPHSPAEAASSACARLLAGRDHAVAVLRERLIDVYVAREPSREPLIPHHPHCTHVVAPVPRRG